MSLLGQVRHRRRQPANRPGRHQSAVSQWVLPVPGRTRRRVGFNFIAHMLRHTYAALAYRDRVALEVIGERCSRTARRTRRRSTRTRSPRICAARSTSAGCSTGWPTSSHDRGRASGHRQRRRPARLGLWAKDEWHQRELPHGDLAAYVVARSPCGSSRWCPQTQPRGTPPLSMTESASAVMRRGRPPVAEHPALVEHAAQIRACV